MFVMKIHEIIFTPRNFYTQEKHPKLQVLKDPEVEYMAKLLTFLQGNKTFAETSAAGKERKAQTMFF